MHISNITSSKLLTEKQADITRIPLQIPFRPSKSVLAKSKPYKKNQLLSSDSNSNSKYYTQFSKGNIREIIKIKKAFPKLSSKKISEIYKVINSSCFKGKPKFSIITKSPSWKQIIISMSISNTERIIV